jgi:hypothetical protein
MKTIALPLLAFAAASAWSMPSRAAELPPHEPISVLIVSDRVNPHDLPSHLLTEPGDLSEAIAAEGSGLELTALSEVDSACIDHALALLHAGAVDVMIYFAHRSARACDGSDQQDALTVATKELLMTGGGVVVFHHGLYVDDGKEAILELLGGRADDLAWAPESGQNVIATAREHFITNNGLSYESELDFAAPELGVAEGRYPAFNNTPDERYPGLHHLERPGEDRTLLFASDYDGPQILSYDLHRPEWSGHVVFYQPGEYKPNALDDLDGNNFQVLANAIHYVATVREKSDPRDETSDTDEPTEGDESSSTGSELMDTTTGDETTGTAMEADDGSGGCSVANRPVDWLWVTLFAAIARRREPRHEREEPVPRSP